MIENLIRSAVLAIPTVQKYMAQYANKPAVFYQTAPHDKDAFWGGKQYPRIDYSVDWTYNPERRTSGSLQLNIWCTNESNIPPEDIADAVVPYLSDLFLTDTMGTYCICWSRSDAFEGTGKEPKTIGITLTFDVYAFPVQRGGSPDPVFSLMQWIKTMQPSACVIGIDSLPEIWKPSDKSPAVYVRVGGGSSNMRPSNAVTWVAQQLVVHVMCPTVAERQTWMRAITDDLAIYQEVRMDDNSPMFVKRLAYNTASNPMIQGQINASVEYGVLRKYPAAPIINHITPGGNKHGH